MIKSDDQFKSLFYLWCCKDCFEDIDFMSLETSLRDYVFQHGYFNGWINQDFYDFDELYMFYLEEGII